MAGVAAFILWLELAVRSALLALAVVFLPLALAGLLWPTTAGWLKRVGEVVGAIAVSKLVIVVTLAPPVCPARPVAGAVTSATDERATIDASTASLDPLRIPIRISSLVGRRRSICSAAPKEKFARGHRGRRRTLGAVSRLARPGGG